MANRCQHIALLHVVKYFCIHLVGDRIILDSVDMWVIYVYAVVGVFDMFYFTRVFLEYLS